MNTLTNRESLVWAAKAAGITLIRWNATYACYETSEGLWNPNINDGDAQRLSVKLGLCVSHWPRQGIPDVMVGYRLTDKDGSNIIVPYDNDMYAATRMAIVMAAIEIGKAMP
jgi:hypothetical protein